MDIQVIWSKVMSHWSDVLSSIALFISIGALIISYLGYRHRKFILKSSIIGDESFIVDPISTMSGNQCSVLLCIMLENNSEVPITVRDIVIYDSKKPFVISPEPMGYNLIVPDGEGQHFWNPNSTITRLPLRIESYGYMKAYLVFPSSFCVMEGDYQPVHFKVMTARGNKKLKIMLSTPQGRAKWFDGVGLHEENDI
ncbi:hypothetical protein [Fumia xinanensis]|uniref:Uncharacterized protein n=1 Tax=Fumia xinanensis TaxID=2763659 RepID=A0A926DZN9_9FIRM|nr:hypothetical protein [Fumia xinanensis]MBC8558859.1 hypothetical protein [Fumia xinanensis]